MTKYFRKLTSRKLKEKKERTAWTEPIDIPERVTERKEKTVEVVASGSVFLSLHFIDNQVSQYEHVDIVLKLLFGGKLTK